MENKISLLANREDYGNQIFKEIIYLLLNKPAIGGNVVRTRCVLLPEELNGQEQISSKSCLRGAPTCLLTKLYLTTLGKHLLLSCRCLSIDRQKAGRRPFSAY